MTEEKKEFDRYPTFGKLSEEQQREFKKALFLTNGAVNNDVGCMLAFYGLSGEDIAKYGASWKDADGVGQALRTRHDPYGARERSKQTWKRLLQQAARIPDLFDTIRGRALVAKYGEEIKDEFCDEQGRCSLNVVCMDDTYEKLLDCVEFIEGSATEYAFRGIKHDVMGQYHLEFDRAKASRLEFLERTKASEIAEAKSKGIDLAALYARAIERRNSKRESGDGLDSYPELQKDFWGFLKQDISSLAHAPKEELERSLRMNEGKPVRLFTISTEIGRQFVGYPYYSEDVYSIAPNATYNALYIRGLYKAMDEMGVGIATSTQMAYPRGRLNTRVKRIAHKVISLNEKYQKMLKNKSNKIEPAILRQTLVGMFNEFADRSCFEFRMFIREDRPAPTLAELHPKKQPKSAKATKTRVPRRRSTGPKEVVKTEDGSTFVEY